MCNRRFDLATIIWGFLSAPTDSFRKSAPYRPLHRLGLEPTGHWLGPSEMEEDEVEAATTKARSSLETSRF